MGRIRHFLLHTHAEHQAFSLKETAASMEGMASTVKQNAESARNANRLVLSAFETAQRAGAQGRGFAVVASEVRKLAQRPCEAGVSVSKPAQAHGVNAAVP